MVKIRSEATKQSMGVVLLLVCLVARIHVGSAAIDLEKPFPAFFIFGDSLVDVGNNNYMVTVARANSLPFGIDFPQGPTGRFTNGKTVLDVIADLIKLPYPPPYLDPKVRGNAILQGVNYASAAAGYLRSSGFNFVGRADFDTQIEWFANTASQVKEILGEDGAKDFLAKSLIATAFGANDYVNNYLLSYAPINKVYTTDQLKYVILDKTKAQLTKIYNLGARIIAVSSLGPIGCIPSQLVRQRSVNGECSEYVNGLARDFNVGLQQVLNELNQEFPDGKFLYADVYTNADEYVKNYPKYGFVSASTACCGRGKYKGQLLCLPFLKACPNRREYVWFDCFHPSEAVNEMLGQALYDRLKEQL
ncbi:hypothetical protein KP509_05G053900 [Ceratopteris richardii]|uniref:GDSL esterase/lipase n=1 Tax=Ceratopteris richardii TaxID=49495 RepID=A0A8T2UT37_CERRI|nr:hypothetical protein KP509_05G053900 [Ceratopteris richardii]